MTIKRIFAALLFLALLSAPAAQAAEPAQSAAPSIRIAFLDSGVSTAHLQASQVEEGKNFVFSGRDTSDRIGHGTATAGIVLGSEELGLVGLCPSATVVPLVCYDAYPTGVSARCDAAGMAEAIYAAVDEYACRIINISMGLTSDEPVLREAIEYARSQGVLIVSAVGNDQLTHPERVYYPAAYDGVLGVGAADGTDTAAFSQRSAVDVIAPGVSLETVTHRSTAKTELRSGTSFSCAYVSGLCAALWTLHPALSADEVCSMLLSLAQDVGAPGFDGDSGWGLVCAQSLSPAARTASALTRWAQTQIEAFSTLHARMRAALL